MKILQYRHKPTLSLPSDHARLAAMLALGLFFAWLLLLPMGGAFLPLIAAADTSLHTLILAFTIGHAAGLLAVGRLTTRQRTMHILCILGPWLCAGLTLLLPQLTANQQTLAFALLGIVAAPLPVYWGMYFSQHVAQQQRGMLMGLSGLLSNGLIYLTGLLPIMRPGYALALLVLLLGLSARSMAHVSRQPLPAVADTTSFSRWNFGVFLGFVLAVSLVGGIMYGAIQPAFAHLPITRWYGVAPYIVALLLAGYLVDRSGRQLPVILGPAILGLAFPAFALIPTVPGYLVTQTLLMSGLALIDLYIWLKLAAHAGQQPGRLFAVGLAVHVGAIALGVFLSSLLYPITAAESLSMVGLASFALFMAALLTTWLQGDSRPPAPPRNALQPAPAPTAIVSLVAPQSSLPTPIGSVAPTSDVAERTAALLEQYHLTRRELDVVQWLLRGASNRVISQDLCISENTLKTHIRNILHKIGVTDRYQLVVLLLQQHDILLQQHIADGDRR